MVDYSIDVIIPVQGTTPWLNESFSSIAQQTLPPTTVILIDDGLENASCVTELGKNLFQDRFRLIKNKGKGISAALNTGVQHSSARWLMRMDTDDVAHPSRIERQLEFLHSAAAEILGCGTQVRFIGENGCVLGRSELPTLWEDTMNRLLHTTCFVHPTLVFRRDILATMPYRSMMDGAEDVDLLLRLAEKGKILNLQDTLLDYRIHPAQESFRFRARHTAVQELAFRSALSRRFRNTDPLELDTSLAEQFINWRLSTPGYVRSRTFLTGLRYMKSHLAHMDIGGFISYALLCMRTFPVSPAAATIAWRVFRKAGAAFVDERSPFDCLNVNHGKLLHCAS